MKGNFRMQQPSVLMSCPLFESLTGDELSAMLVCLGTRTYTFARGQFILSEAMPAQFE